MSESASVSAGRRFVAADWNATNLPSTEMAGWLLSPFPFTPLVEVDTSVTSPVARFFT